MSISWTTASSTTSCVEPFTEEAFTTTGNAAVISAVPCGVSWNSCRSAVRPLPAVTTLISW